MDEPQALPRQAAELADALGEDGLRALVAAFGGLRIRVHAAARPETELAQRLGADLYARLQAFYAGEEIDIPMLAADRSRGRARRILALRAQGWTAARIARAEGCTLRWVRELLARERERPDQLELDL